MLFRSKNCVSLRRRVAQDIADDLFEDEFDVVAHAWRLRQFLGVECMAQFIESMCEGRQRSNKSELNRMRVDVTSQGEAGPGQESAAATAAAASGRTGIISAREVVMKTSWTSGCGW